MTACFDYPKTTAFGRVLPKTKLYEQANATSALKDRFVIQVEQIVWAHKLAPETLNLAATDAVTEIQVFQIRLKTPGCDLDILRAIDKAIPFPLLFELTHGGQRRAVAAYKRPSAADRAKRVLSDYFQSDWEAEDTPRRALPVVLNLSGLYERLLGALMPAPATEDEDLQTRVARTEAIQAQARTVERIQARLNRERQFNKRVVVNAELRAAKEHLQHLSRPRGGGDHD